MLAVFVGLHNTLTPSDRIAVVGRIVEATSNVAGTFIPIQVEPNALIKTGTILFQIDRTSYDAKVKQLKMQIDLAVAEVKGLASHSEYCQKRRDDTERLAWTSTPSPS
jgi:multidrug resistance efflux pump